MSTFQDSKSGVLKVFGDSFRHDSNNLYTSPRMLFAKLYTGQYATLLVKMSLITHFMNISF